MVTGVVPSSPRSLPSIFIAHSVQQSHCSSIFHRVLLTHALALSASQLVRKKKSPRMYTSMHSGGFELTKLTYTRLEDNLIRHRGDRLGYTAPSTRHLCRTKYQQGGLHVLTLFLKILYINSTNIDHYSGEKKKLYNTCIRMYRLV